MISRRPLIETAGSLLFLASIAHSGPVEDPSTAPASLPNEAAWGDPEAVETSDAGWTWFGMGYERRNRERTERSIKAGTLPNNGGGSSGNERSRR